VTGLSHHTSPLALRERLHFPETTIAGALITLRKRLPNAGLVILSTCNRVEIYVHHDSQPTAIQNEVAAFLAEWHGLSETDFRETLYTYINRDAASHLFRVAASLDSLVVGEQQILGQVHDAFLLAQAEQVTDKVIAALFQRAFSIAKEVRTNTNIGAGKVSVSSVAVDLAVSIFTELKGKTVMIVGTGKMGELTLKSLVSHGVDQFLMVNRSVEKAHALAEPYKGEAVQLDSIYKHLHRADIVISSTGSAGYVLLSDHFSQALRERGGVPMFVIDIAVPRDVDPAVNGLNDVFLYDVDSLQQVANANLDARRREIARSMEIVDQGVEKFWGWIHGLAAEPTIVSMVEELNAIRQAELEKTLGNLPELTEQEREEIEYLTKRIVNKILQRPLAQLKREVTEQTDPHSVLHLVKRLFGLKELS
jgi:glutamyl-tRNA reductase